MTQQQRLFEAIFGNISQQAVNAFEDSIVGQNLEYAKLLDVPLRIIELARKVCNLKLIEVIATKRMNPGWADAGQVLRSHIEAAVNSH